MSDVERHVRVALYWGGKTIHDADTVRYSCGPRVFVKLPVSLTYAHLVRLLQHKMESSTEEVKFVISGRFPYSVVGQSVCYTEMPIVDDESLQDFLVVPDTIRSFMALILLEMYIKSEVAVVSEPPSDVMNNSPDIGCHTKVVTQNTQPQLDVPSDSCGQGNQNVSTNFSVETFPSFGFGDGKGTSRTTKIGDVPKVSQLQVRVNSDPCVNASHDDFDGDAPHDANESHNDDDGDTPHDENESHNDADGDAPHDANELLSDVDGDTPHDANESDEITDSGGKNADDYQQQAEDVSNVPVQMDVKIGDVPTVSQIQAHVNNDRCVNGSHDNSDGDAPHDSNELDEIPDCRGKSDDGVQMDEAPLLSELQDRPEVSTSTSESENIESTVWMDWDKELETGMLFESKEDLKSAVVLWNLQQNRDFCVCESSRKAWMVKCGQWENGCSWMLRGRETTSNLWMVGYQPKQNLWKVGKYYETHSCQTVEPSKMVYNRSFARQVERMTTTHIRYAMDIGHATYPEASGICKETGNDMRDYRPEQGIKKYKSSVSAQQISDQQLHSS